MLMFEVVMKCLNSKSPAVNWTKHMSKEDVIDLFNDLYLDWEKIDWDNNNTVRFSEMASSYKVTVCPLF